MTFRKKFSLAIFSFCALDSRAHPNASFAFDTGADGLPVAGRFGSQAHSNVSHANLPCRRTSRAGSCVARDERTARPAPRPQGRHIRGGAGIKPAPPLGSIFYAADMPAAAYLPDTALFMSAAMRTAALHPVHPPQPPEQPRGLSAWQSHIPRLHRRCTAHAAHATTISRTPTVGRLNSRPKITARLLS